MVVAHDISKHYGSETILKEISFNLNHGEHVGLIGPNGCGKTTLLRILAGQIPADEGHVTISPPSLQIGYVAQSLDIFPDVDWAEYQEDYLLPGRVPEEEITRLAVALAKEPDRDDLQLAYDKALSDIVNQDRRYSSVVKQSLSQFGLGDIPSTLNVNALSGGQKMRLALLGCLASESDMLLLDEPTNHLDFSMLGWLENWLNHFPGTVLIVTHDRMFLDRTVGRILVIQPEDHTLRSYTGNYSAYLEQVKNELDKRWALYKEQQQTIRSFQMDIVRTKNQSRRVEITTTPGQPYVRRLAKKVARKALAREKKLERYLSSPDLVEKPTSSWQLKVDWRVVSKTGKDVLKLEGVSLGYPSAIPLITDLSMNLCLGERVVLTGSNGFGKTTLLRAIAGQIGALEGKITLGSNVRVGFLEQEQDSLPRLKSAFEMIHEIMPGDETAIRTFLHLFLFQGDDALRPVRNLSIGERTRLTLAMLIAQGSNFLLLDEPVNHLDIASRERFEQALLNFNGTIIAVAHDRVFIRKVATQLWKIENNKVIQVSLLTDED